MPDLKSYTLPNNHTIVLRTLVNQSNGLMAGKCPVCRVQGAGQPGACIIEHAPDSVTDGRRAYRTGWGHLQCIENRFDEIVRSYENSKIEPQVDWRIGRQRDFIEFVLENQRKIVEVEFDQERGQRTRYRYRIARTQSEE